MSLINKSHALEIELVITAGAYSDGDVVGGLLDLNKLVGAGGGGTIRQVLIVDEDQQDAAFDLYLFDADPTGTEIADNAVFATTMDADAQLKKVGKVEIAATDYEDLNSIATAIKSGLNFAHGSGQLRGYLVVNDATPPTYTGSDKLKMKITGWLD